MQRNEEVVSAFYSAFQKLDAEKMNAQYSNDIVFYDPVFELLRGEQVKAMWQMLCGNAKDFSLKYDNIKDLGDGYYTCDWIANYTFSKTGRRVENRAKANMKLDNGMIVEHSDAFSLHKWAAQAMGFSGWLLGWNKFYVWQIKNSARKNLLNFMQNNQ